VDHKKGCELNYSLTLYSNVAVWMRLYSGKIDVAHGPPVQICSLDFSFFMKETVHYNFMLYLEM
jgi:hypothetical protein